MKRYLYLTSFVVVCWCVPASAVTVAGGPGDEIMARLYQSYVSVWSPVIALASILALVLAAIAGHRIGPRALAVLLVLVFLGGGLSLMSAWSGGGIAAGATRPPMAQPSERGVRE